MKDPDDPQLGQVFSSVDRHSLDPKIIIFSCKSWQLRTAEMIISQLGMLCEDRIGPKAWAWFTSTYKAKQQTSIKFDSQKRCYVSMDMDAFQDLAKSKSFRDEYEEEALYNARANCFITNLLIEPAGAFRTPSVFPSVYGEG